jgi:hypothetical protein
MGRLLMVCENDRADSANLRLWDAGNPIEPLKELASTRTTGQVRDTPILRGNQLVVPSAGENFAAFIVTDEPDRAKIAPIGQYEANRAQGQLESPLVVALGADGLFWSAGSAFRRFEIAGGSIRMDPNAAAQGIASQPLQLVGDNFFVGRKSRYSDAVTFSAIEREKLIVPWRSILGDQPLELLPTRDGGAFWVGESGTLYSVSKNRLGQGGADPKAGNDLELPSNLTQPLRATALPDQRMVVAATGDTSVLLMFNSAGQLTSKITIDAQPETDPVLLDVGLVLPLPSKLKVQSLTGGRKPVVDWVAPIGEGLHQRWSHLVRIDGRELIAIDQSGLLSRIQYRDGDVSHLAEVAKLQLDTPIDTRPFQSGEFLFVADAKGNCRQLNIHSFDIDGERALPAPVRNLWQLGNGLVAYAGDRRLYCLSEGKGLPERWTLDLGNLEPIGPLIVKDETVWIAARNGTVLALNASNGKEVRRVTLPQTLSLGLRQIGDLLVAIAVDGAIYKIE